MLSTEELTLSNCGAWEDSQSPLDSKEIKWVNPKGNQPWIFTGRTDAETEAPILWPLDANSDSLEKALILGKTEGGRRGRQRMRWLDGITESMDISLSNSGRQWRTGKSGVLRFMQPERAGHSLMIEQMNWKNSGKLLRFPVLPALVNSGTGL